MSTATIKTTLNPWSWPTRPWTRLHLDFAGLVQGKMFLILIDSHSKWIAVMITMGSTSAIVTQALRTWFAQFGLPEIVVTDNGPGFASEEFEVFLQNNGIKHILSAPYHPSSTELAVQIVKRGLKKNTEGSLTTRLARILFAYRTTPQSTTGVSPTQLLFGRQPRTRLALLRPNIASHVEDKQSQQHDKKARARNFSIGDSVLIRNFSSGQKWMIGMVIQIAGLVSYMVRLNDHTIHRRHQDQLRIFRGSVDTDVSLADVPLVENLAEVTSLTEIEGVYQPELEFPVPTVQSNTPSLEVDRSRHNVEIADIPETTEQPSEPSAPELDVSLPITTHHLHRHHQLQYHHPIIQDLNLLQET